MSGAWRILEKGPDYLRKQMELEAKVRVSAAERLAATKPQYVKSPQVVSSTQEPVTGVGSASVSSHGSSKRSSGDVHARAADEGAVKEEQAVKRSSSKKRPDSLLLYRQRCDLQREREPGASSKRNLTRRLLLNSLKDRTNALARGKETGAGQNGIGIGGGGGLPATGNQASRADTQPALPASGSTDVKVEEEEGEDEDEKKKREHCRPRTRVSRRGVARSHSDVSSRYSKSFADFDTFFKYCGLEDDVVASMGRERFSTCSENRGGGDGGSTSESDECVSRASGDSDGLQADELRDACRQGSSVVERNARIIKWLYSCRNAAQSGKALRDLD